MRHKLLRLLLTFMLVLTVPLQSMAMAEGMACAGHHERNAAPSSAVHHASTVDHHLGSLDHDQHEAHMYADQDQNPPASDLGAKSQKCNMCAPCCLGAALIPSHTPITWKPGAIPQFAAVDDAVASVDRGRLDRPPKSILA